MIGRSDRERLEGRRLSERQRERERERETDRLQREIAIGRRQRERWD